MTKTEHFTRIFNEVDGVDKVTDYTRDLHSDEGSQLLAVLTKVWNLFKKSPDKAFKEFELEFKMIHKLYGGLPRIEV